MSTLCITRSTDTPLTCYACDLTASGAADRRHDPENALVPACTRHAHVGLRLVVRRQCYLCGKGLRLRVIDGDLVHSRCLQRECDA